MRALHDKKKVLFASVAVASLIFCVFMLLATTNTIANVSAVEANGVGVYWDSDCTDRVFSIDWGTLTPGSVKNIVIYIRNEGEEPIFLIMSTTNWNPSNASKYIILRWDYAVSRIDPGEILQITQTLSISRYIEGISNYSFDIVITGSQRLPGDVNGDNMVNGLDVLIVTSLANSMQTVPPADPNADMNGDGMITGLDILIVISKENFMTEWPP